jgi:HlyD family secretion protein
MSYHPHILLTIVLVLSPWSTRAAGEDQRGRFVERQLSGNIPADGHPTEFLPLPGIVQPVNQVTMSAPLEGMLRELHVREGQRVEEGELLAVIDNRVAQAAVNAARAAADRSGERQQAYEDLKFAQEVLARQLVLKAANGGSEFELLEAQTRLEKAKAVLVSVEQDQVRAQQLLELEQARLEAHNIRAPFRGEIARLYAYPGTTLTRDDQLLTLIRVDELKAELHVALDFYQQLRVGVEYSLRAGPPVNHVVTGRLQYVAPVIDAASRTCRVVFTLDNHDQQLPAGFSVYLDTPIPPANLTQVATP